MSWIFFKIKYVFADNRLATSYHLFNYRLRQRERSSKKKLNKTPTKKKKTIQDKKRGKGENFVLKLIKELTDNPSIPKILRKIFTLFRHLLNSFSIRRLDWDISIDDYYIQGILHGLISGFPETRKIAIKGNFEEINCFSLRAHLSIIKIVGTLFIFVITFPYLDSLRLYKKIKTFA
ncbi:MAG: hypothetical protein GY786_06295 [Proteobacteria bacterium]|nr:hypothetical protein [Pseudomonadota bacterium]